VVQVIFLWACEPAGGGSRGGGEEVELARGLRHETLANWKREEKGWRELMERRRGTNGFITCQRTGLADGSAPRRSTKRGGASEGGHGPLHRDGGQLTGTQIAAKLQQSALVRIEVTV
jgi:hypothetical protein